VSHDKSFIENPDLFDATAAATASAFALLSRRRAKRASAMWRRSRGISPSGMSPCRRGLGAVMSELTAADIPIHRRPGFDRADRPVAEYYIKVSLLGAAADAPTAGGHSAAAFSVARLTAATARAGAGEVSFANRGCAVIFCDSARCSPT
jgi:hypothetical protein